LAPTIIAHARRGSVALLFGREDRGLSNHALDRCHNVIVIPTAPDYPSLNLAHAAAIVAYELLLATQGGERPLPAGRRRGRPATHADLEEMYQVLESALHAVDFFKSRNVTGVMRALRTLLSRAEPDLRETHLLRAIGYEVVNYIERRDSVKE
ncbi:MAG: tRNA (cytosine(32)/uridine(32)-2'-O)-methyltransferase TrmJ, partial [Gemmatimonadetes bacterium]|nr:tRNA (cytosine(32)/uridine(32)-2'-O)-methyltransferase TrmJ [Gemmatimonadota bacterium]